MDLISSFSHLYSFLVIENFTALMTLVAGLVALKIYNSQKREEKINAATIILAEVRNTEQKMEEVSDILRQKLANNSANAFPSVISLNSWQEYSYLFASDFDSDDLKSINNFYDIAESVQEMIHRDNSFLWLNAEFRAQTAQSKLADLISSLTNKRGSKAVKDSALQLAISNVVWKLATQSYYYAPQETLTRLQTALAKFSPITTTEVGSKLKQQTKRKWHLL